MEKQAIQRMDRRSRLDLLYVIENNKYKVHTIDEFIMKLRELMRKIRKIELLNVLKNWNLLKFSRVMQISCM